MSKQRPTLAADPDWMKAARDAVDVFVGGLQAGIDSADAEAYNADFAEDVMWGSPYGATVIGYDALHPIHRAMFESGVAVAGASSRYQAVHVMAPAPDVAVAHVTNELSGLVSAAGEQLPAHRELSIRVLVKERGRWLVTAFHNTIVRPVEPVAREK